MDICDTYITIYCLHMLMTPAVFRASKGRLLRDKTKRFTEVSLLRVPPEYECETPTGEGPDAWPFTPLAALSRRTKWGTHSTPQETLINNSSGVTMYRCRQTK